MKSENAQLSKIELETWKEMKELTRVYFRSKVSLLIYSQGKTSPSIRLLGITVWVILFDFEWSFEMSDFRRKYDNISAGRIVFWVSRTDFSTVILIFFPLSTTSWGQGSPDNFIGLIQWIKMLLLRKSSHDGWIMSIRPELYRGDHSRVPSKAVLRDPDASHVPKFLSLWNSHSLQKSLEFGSWVKTYLWEIAQKLLELLWISERVFFQVF